MNPKSPARSMWIAPSRYPKISNWTSDDWKQLNLASQEGWKTAIEIFEDRINYRYLDAIDVLQTSDDEHYREHQQRRFGFSMMALDCLLIETLAQFYNGLKDSTEARETLGLDNKHFYVRFLTHTSFTLHPPFDKSTATLFYETVRCGILHQAETKESTTIRYRSDRDPTIALEPMTNKKGLLIYWVNFHPLVMNEYRAYCDCLKTNQPSGYHDNFIRKMNFICH